MAFTLCVQDVAIAEAIKSDTLKVTKHTCWHTSEPYWSINDEHGVIEVALSAQEAEDRIADIRERLS